MRIDDERRRPALRREVAEQPVGEHPHRVQDPEAEEDQADEGDEGQRPGPGRDDEAAEVRDQLAERVVAGRTALRPHRDRAGADVGDDPREGDVEVDAGAGVGGGAAADLAEDEAVAVERLEVRVAHEPLEHPLGEARAGVAQEAVRRRVGGRRVDQLRPRLVGAVEQRTDVRRVVLAVLVHRDDPLAARRRHAGQGRRMLAEVAGQPDRAHPVVLVRQLADALLAGRGSAVPDQDDLADAEGAPRGGQGRLVQSARSRR